MDFKKNANEERLKRKRCLRVNSKLKKKGRNMGRMKRQKKRDALEMVSKHHLVSDGCVAPPK